MSSSCSAFFRMTGSLLGAALLSLLLNACSWQAPTSAAMTDLSLSQSHYDSLALVKAWHLHGKLAVRHGDRSWQIGLRWRHSDSEDLLRVFDLMGRQLLRAQGNQHSMQIRDNRGNRHQVATADFIEELIGQAVSPASLSAWVLGQIWPRAESQVLAVDDQGRIVRMRQLGWTIHYSEYRQHAHGVVLPKRIVCENDNFQLTVLSHDWRVCLMADECQHV